MNKTIRTLIACIFCLVSFEFNAQDNQFATNNQTAVPNTGWLNKLNLSRSAAFVENVGQFDEIVGAKNKGILYQVEENSMQVSFTSKGLIYKVSTVEKVSEHAWEQYMKKNHIALREENEKEESSVERYIPKTALVEMNWEGANSQLQILTEDITPNYFNYYRPDIDKDKVFGNVKGFKKITYKNVYPNIDIEYTIHPEDGIKYSYILYPGANPSMIKMNYSGAKIKFDADKNIEFSTDAGNITDHAPLTFKMQDPAGKIIESKFELIDKNTVGFKLANGNLQITETTVIDPWQVGPTLLTGFTPNDVAVDGASNSLVFSFKPGNNTSQRIDKYSPLGVLIWTFNLSTGAGYTGSGQGDVKADPTGNVYASIGLGKTAATIYNTIKINPTGTALIWGSSTGSVSSNNIFETWTLSFNCDYTKFYQSGGGLIIAGTVYFNISVQEPVNAATGVEGVILEDDSIGEIICTYYAPNNLVYHMAADSNTTPNRAGALLAPTSGTHNVLTCYNPVTGARLFRVPSGYSYADGDIKAPGSIGINAIVSSCSFLYTMNGAKLDRWNPTTGAHYNQVTITGGSTTAGVVNSGILADKCGNIYVGSNGNIYVYSPTLVLINTITGFPGIIFDMAWLNTANTEIVACGGTSNATTFLKSVAVAACVLPNLVTATPTQPTCITALGTATAAATFCGAPYTYSWTNGQTTQVATGLTPGTYTVTVASSVSCPYTYVQSQTVTITAAPGSPTVTVNSATLCSGASAILTASGATTYSWSPATGLSATTGASVTANPTVSTTYTVTGTTAGCNGTNSSTVTVSTTPTVTATASNSVICLGNSTILTGGGASTYTWTGGVTNGVAFSPTVTATYTVTGTSASGCTNTAVKSITVNPIPTTTASTTGTLTCTTLTVALNSTLAGVNYTWVAPAGGSVASANTQSTTASGATGTYSLFVQSAAGCAYSTTTSVTQNTVVPTGVSAGSNQTLTCGSSSVTVSGAVTTPTNATVNWTGASVCGVATNYTTSVCGAGTYTLTATDLANGCTATSTVQVFPSAGAPVVTNNPVTNTITCTNTLVTVSISTTATPVTYTWSGTGIVFGNGTGTITVNQGGTFQYTVTNTLSGCTTSNNQVVVQNTTIPTTTASTTGTLTCSTPTVNLNSTLAGMNYTWTAPAGSSVSTGTNTQNAIGAGAGTYSLVVINPSNGCSFNTTTSVSQNTVVPTTTASVTGTVTCSTPTVNLNSTLAGINYTWTAPAGSSVSNGTNTQNAIGAGAGTYSLTVINPSNGCSYTTTVTANQDVIAPTLTVSPMTYTLSCSSFTVPLTATTTNTTVSYVWTTNGSLNNTTIANPIATGSGTYNVIVTNTVNGCQSTQTATIFPSSGSPTLSISSTTLVLDCNNASQSVTVTSTPSVGVIYNWNVTPFSASLDSSQATFNNPNTYICTVTNTLSNCSTTIQVVVTTNTVAPIIQISNPQVLTCSNPSVTISTTVTPLGSTFTYTWSGGQNTGSIVVNSPNIYSVSVTNTVNGCTNTATAAVTSNTTIPVAGINATPSNGIITCQNPTVILTATATPVGGYSYIWSIFGSVPSSTITISTPGIYSVVVTNTATGCSTSAQYTVSSNTVVPTISATNTVMACGATSVNVVSIATPTNNISYSWSTSNGSIITNGFATAVVGSVGIYTVTATDATNGCVNTATASVTQNGISAAFSANPMSGTAPLLVNFTNQSIGATSYTWTLGNGVVSTSTNPSTIYTGPGTYVVTLVAANGCTATATLNIEVFENSTLIIPNVFTPNGDGINEVFKITSTGIRDLTCDIFNRWGTKLYTITSVNDSWNGSNNSDGTYFFILKATGFDGKVFTEHGFLNIFR